MTDQEINKTCAKLMGRKWREEMEEDGAVGIRNPNYLNNKSDWVDFLHWCITEWEGWDRFLISIQHSLIFGFNPSIQIIIKYLFKDTTTLPMAIYKYCKEKEDGN